jgi:putative inorganic carbon (hco3(-)) transporter
VPGLIDSLLSSISLEKTDTTWNETCKTSVLGKLLAAIKTACSGGKATSPVGTILQRLAFIIVLLLFVAIGAPQFAANDKEGLALIALAGFGLWLLGYIMGGTEVRPSNSLDIPIWLFLGANIVATAASHYPIESLRGLAKVAVYIASYFLFSAVLRRSSSRRIQIAIVLVATAFGLALFGLYQYKIGVAPLATWEDPTVEIKGTRIFSTLQNPNLLAGYLIPIAPIAAALTVIAWMRKQRLLALLAGAATATISAASLLTGSRGGYIAIFVCIAAVAYVAFAKIWSAKPNSRRSLVIYTAVAAILLPAGLALGLHFVPAFDQRVSSIFAGWEHSSNAFRFHVYEASLHMFKDNWWFGIGPGNQAFIMAYGLYMRSGFDALGAYSVPLEVAVECGVMGLLIFAAIFTITCARAHLAFWSGTDPSDRWLAVGAAVGLIGMMSQGFGDTVFYRPQVQFIFWLLIAIVVCCRQKEPQP